MQSVGVRGSSSGHTCGWWTRRGDTTPPPCWTCPASSAFSQVAPFFPQSQIFPVAFYCSFFLPGLLIDFFWVSFLFFGQHSIFFCKSVTCVHSPCLFVGEENELMNDAHCKSVFLLAEPFGADGVYDFHKAQIPARIASTRVPLGGYLFGSTHCGLCSSNVSNFLLTY